MSPDSVEYKWEQLQQRLEQKFCKYFQNDSEMNECGGEKSSHQQHTLSHNKEERSEIN